MNDIAPTDTEATITFGGYANPSFEAQVETVGKASTSSIMSVEAQVDELWGDTRDKKWKQEEVKSNYLNEHKYMYLQTDEGVKIFEEKNKF